MLFKIYITILVGLYLVQMVIFMYRFGIMFLRNGGHVLRFNPDGSFKNVFISDNGGVGNLNRPEGLVFDPDGNLYITSFPADTTDTDSIRIYSANGDFLRKIDLDIVGQPRAYAQAIIFGPNRHLFVPIIGRYQTAIT